MVPRPLTTGCTINGTSTGNCCDLATISTRNNLTTCLTSPHGVDQLQSCLYNIAAPAGRDNLACNFGNNGNTSTSSNSVPLTAASSNSQLKVRTKMGVLGLSLMVTLTVSAQST
ncbi:uncharacterized protein UTRI_02632 [Ustilago trichophora]|uniref:Uncharacterized protein n=1 Tax=Ustilago trichophora TaxID=86804 RepID=A0A5C3EPR3_9BASI|nr:uncharacterized protein UTRI_02632 [Ustilago trichophora]